MSRFIVTSGSDFRPFSYDELIKPVQASAEAHAAAADAYDQLSMETAALGNYISTDEGSGDVRARAMYDNYVQKLQNFQNNLWENGVTAATRRDMSAARAAYAQDITRLQKAIQDRQERSKEYWDARHKNPDLIMGFDPRNGGLDNYLDNNEYGRDWYSYSGTQFANEVGSEVKARAAELFELGAAGSGVPGYLLQIQKQGFTNADVDAANILARQALAGQINLDNIDDSAPKLLANVLMSRLQSTGINPGKNVSAEEFNRMLNYGSIGLAQGVGETNKKLIEDKAWEQQQKYNLAAYQHRLSHPVPQDPANDEEGGYGYVLNAISEYRGNSDADNQNQLYGGNMYDYKKDGAIPVKYNGKDDLIDSQEKAIAVFDEMGRSDIMNAYGIDPNSKIVGRGGKFLEVAGTIKDKDGNDVPLRMRYVPLQSNQRKSFENSGWMQPTVENGKITFKYDPVAVEYYDEKSKQWKLDPNQTNSFNRENRYYQEQREKLQRQLPKGVDVNSLALVGDRKRKAYREDNIPENTPHDVAQAIHEAKNWQGRTTNSILGNFDTSKAVDYYAGAIKEAHLKNRGRLSVASPLAFYRVDENGDYSKKGEINEASVFGTTGSASNPKTNYESIVSVTVSPEDIYASHPRIRFVTEMGEFGTDPSYFGTGAEQLVDNLRQPVVLSNGMNLDPDGIVHYLMLPLSDPVRVSKMSDAGMRQWESIASQLIGRRAPRHTDGSIASPQEILMNPNARAALRSAIGDFLNEEFSRDRDAHLQNGFKVTEKALPYIISSR